MKSNCNLISSAEVRLCLVGFPRGKSFSKMPSSLKTNTLILIVGPHLFFMMVEEGIRFMANSCTKMEFYSTSMVVVAQSVGGWAENQWAPSSSPRKTSLYYQNTSRSLPRYPWATYQTHKRSHWTQRRAGNSSRGRPRVCPCATPHPLTPKGTKRSWKQNIYTYIRNFGLSDFATVVTLTDF